MSSAEEDLLAELVAAPDRDHCPGARPVVSYHEDDEPAYLDSLDAHTLRRVALHRRGVWHGDWAELREDLAPSDTFPLEARLSQRWHEARPIVIRGLFTPTQGAEIGREREGLFEALAEVGGLRTFLRTVELSPQFELGVAQELADRERDIERHGFTWRLDPGASSTPVVSDLWAKSAWLSTHDGDRSLRLRVSFGAEGIDDGSRDHRRHRRVSELAASLFEEAEWLDSHEELRARIDGFAGEPTFLTQQIAYWNAPSGGARFHHDAFDEERLGGQLGVCYVQFGGVTAWLGLSNVDLAARVLEALEYMDEGELGWVRNALWPTGKSFDRALTLARNPRRCAREIMREGCGAFGGLVERGPEFTSLLADAGHGFLLGPGDAVLLPSHGFERACLHSVFCGSEEEVAYGLSSAIRPLHPPEPTPPPEAAPPPDDRPPSLRRQRAQRRRRRG